MWAMLIVGQSLPFLWRLAPGLLLLAWLASGLGVVSLAMKIKSMGKVQHTSLSQQLGIPTRAMGLTENAGPSVISGALVLLFSAMTGLAGYSYAQYTFSRDRHTYVDVAVVARHDAKHFTLQPARMEPWETGDLCTSVDWQAGQKMRLLSYQQKPKCKDVVDSGSYEFYTHDGQRVNYLQETIANAGQ